MIYNLLTDDEFADLLQLVFQLEYAPLESELCRMHQCGTTWSDDAKKRSCVQLSHKGYNLSIGLQQSRRSGAYDFSAIFIKQINILQQLSGIGLLNVEKSMLTIAKKAIGNLAIVEADESDGDHFSAKTWINYRHRLDLKKSIVKSTFLMSSCFNSRGKHTNHIIEFIFMAWAYKKENGVIRPRDFAEVETVFA